MRTQRRLPHVYREDRWLLVTWNLHGSLPRPHYPPLRCASSGRAFVRIDRQLDAARWGPLFLRQPALAQLVCDSIHRGVQLRHYRLGPFVVMANHVHMLLLPLVHPSRLLQSLKGFTAREANRLLKRTGEPFWRRES